MLDVFLATGQQPHQNSTVQDRIRHQLAAVSVHPHYWFVCGRLMLHDSPDLVVRTTEIWAVWRPQIGRKKVRRFLTQQFNCLRVRGAVCRYTVLLEHKVVARHSVYRWQHYDVIMTSWSSTKEVSKRYPQNFFLLCNNNEITACIADLFNSFCEEVYAVAFFKVVQQQTVGEVGKSIVFMGR